jgi:hypothetical protein
MSAFDPLAVRRRLFATIAAAVTVSSLLVVLADDDTRPLFTNWTINASVTAAFALAVMVAARQGLSGLYGPAQVAIAIALALWLGAEFVWTYYELGLGVEVPFPSAADAAWLAGYAPFAYYLFKVYGFFGKGRPKLALAVSAVTAAFVAYTAVEVVAASADPEGDALSLAVSLAYVALDGMVIVPAVMVLTRLRKETFTSVPWFLISISILLAAAGDVGYAYYTAAGIEGEWVWDVLFNADYVVIAATIFWHNRFFIFDSRRARDAWQKENR